MADRAKDLDGKVAIVTGGGIPGAIGAVTAEALAEAGALVVLADRAGTPLADVAASLRGKGYVALHKEVDMREEDSIAALIAFTMRDFGRLDIIDNNAAATHLVPHDRDLLSMDAALWDETMSVNLRGPMLMCKHGIPEMLKGGGGAIVNISSGHSLAGDVRGPAYAVSKAALNHLTVAVATLYGAQGIRCNTVINGLIATPLMKASVPTERAEAIQSHCLVPRLGEPVDIANLVVFLASDRASYITAQMLAVDGGYLSHMPIYAWSNSTSVGVHLKPVA
jgi:NAD(P)-dependent dehydrogenase (short-subunit alcohol dehydrogenase family)